LANKAVGDADYAPGATSATSAINAITYSSSNTAVATIVSGNIRIIGAGTTTITASQASSTNYNAATDVAQTLNVSGILPVIGAIQTLYAQNFNGIGTGATATLPTGFVLGTNWTTGTTATTATAFSSGTAPTTGGLYNFGSEYNEQYFEHMLKLDEELIKVDENKSGICHHMMFEKKYINNAENWHKNIEYYIKNIKLFQN
jgi:hypothetical protein